MLPTIHQDKSPSTGPLTAAAILDEIYRQRSIEQFMSGLKLEDMRRFFFAEVGSCVAAAWVSTSSV